MKATSVTERAIAEVEAFRTKMQEIGSCPLPWRSSPTR